MARSSPCGGLQPTSAAVIEILQIILHHRLQVSIYDCRGGAFVLAEFGKDLV